jgi:3-oxoacyl-[acyl-carrier protein] reductase
MNQDLSGQTVLVTGASRGIGAALAQGFAEQGATVAVHYHSDRKSAEHVLGSLKGGPHLLVQADLADPETPGPLVERVVAESGRIDVVVNNAGVWEFHPIAEVDFDKWRNSWEKTIGANLFGPAHLSFHAAQRMIAQGGGKIINISSRGAFRGEPKAPAYGAAKAGLNALSQSLAQALAPHGVMVYTIAPGFIETDMAAIVLDGPEGEAIRAQSPLNRVGRPEEIARIAVFLAGPETDYLTGCIIDANGASYLRT